MDRSRTERYFIQPALILYASLPALVSGVTGLYSPGYQPEDPRAVFLTGLILFLLQAGLCVLLFRIKKRWTALFAGLCSFLIPAAAGVLAGFFIHPVFFRMVICLYPSPVLTVAYSLIHKFMKRQAFEQLARSINRILLLLISYAVMLPVIQIRQGIPVAAFLYESLNFIPAVLYLVRLRNSAERVVLLSPGGVRYRNEDIGSSFSRMQIFMIRFFLAHPDRRLRCRDILRTAGEWVPDCECTPEEGCKPSLCPGYAAVYRNIHDLKGKLENLGIGSIQSPGNKRDIRDEGWSLMPFRGVRFRVKGHFPADREILSGTEVPGPAESPAGGTGRLKSPVPLTAPGDRKWSWKYLSPMALPYILLSSFFLAAEFTLSLNLTGGTGPVFAAAFTLGSVCFLLPFGFSGRKDFLRALAVCICLQQVLTLSAAPFSDEILNSFLVLKNLVVCTALLLMQFSRLEAHFPLEGFRRRAPDFLFWLIWFYIVAVLTFRNPFSFSAGMTEVVAGRGGLTVLFLLHDRFLFVLLFIQSIIFNSLPRKYLKVMPDRILFRNRELPPGLSEDSVRLMREFFLKDRGSLFCRDIVSLLYPEESGRCGSVCKPSVCPAYQRIYKRIRVIRKYLETTGIGTIISPERKPGSREAGWQFVLYEDVYLHHAPQDGAAVPSGTDQPVTTA